MQNNEEEDTKNVLLKMLSHIRVIKLMRQRLDQIEEEKVRMKQQEKEIIFSYKKWQDEV